MEKINFIATAQTPITQEAYEQGRVVWFNESVFEKKYHYDCPICKDKGLIANMGSRGAVVISPCECAKREQDRKRYANAMTASGLGDRFLTQRFDNFQTNKPWRAGMKKTAQAWAEGNVGWLLLCGQSGCGKTHLGLAACRYRLDKRRQFPLILSWRDYFSSQSKTQDREYCLKKLREAKEAELLYIDDFLKTARNPWDIPSWEQDLAFELLDYRYNTGLDTIISTEWSVSELLDISEALGGRILQAAGSSIFQVEKNRGNNYRLGH